MLHLLSVITAASILAAGVGLVSAEAASKDLAQKPTPADSPPVVVPPPRDLPPGAEGRSVDPETENAPVITDDDDDDTSPED